MPSPASPKRVLICEGLEGACFPEVRYVVQGQGDDIKVCVFEGTTTLNRKALHESVGGNFTLVESTAELVLVEREGKNYVKDGRWFVEGVFQRSDVKNANGRVYSRKIWERHIANVKSPVQENVKQRGMVGVFEHPGDGRTRGPDSALVVTDLKLQEDGTVWGKAELLDTPNGLILQELTAKKVRWGVSSRGTGTIDDKGNVSESDYQVDTWDAVMRPSTPGAFPRPVGEAKGKGVNEDANDETRKALVKTISEALDKPLAKSVTESQAAAVRYVVDMLKTAEPLIAPEEQEDANSVFKLLCKRVNEAEVAILAAAVDESARRARGEPVKEHASTPALAGVLEHLRTRVAAAIQEATEAKSRTAQLESEAGLSRRKLQEAERENAALKAKLAAATAVIASRSRRSVDEGSPMTVEQYIDDIPALAKYRTVLEAADSAKLEAIVDALLPTALAEPVATDRVDEEVTAPRRAILPHGLQVSESLPAKKPVGAAPALNEQDQQRVRVAAAAVARMGAALITD